MPSKLWEDIKKTVMDGVSVAAEKTEEYTKIGKVKVEILNINRNIDKVFTDLGREVFHLISKGKKAEISKSNRVNELVNKIKDLKASLKEKESEIEAVKREAASNKEEEPKTPESPKAPKAPKTPKDEKPATAVKKKMSSKGPSKGKKK